MKMVPMIGTAVHELAAAHAASGKVCVIRKRRGLRPVAVAAAALLSICATAGASVDPGQPDLARMSLEELGSIIVTSVSKNPEPLSDAAASIFVITREDIRRSGATSLPEVLRLAPNLQVARASASGYSISARGFNGSQANKLLVLIDGRSIYTPLFSGVFWDVQDILLDDVERIEVISGPGGTLWGVNAVNGVINVITRSSKDTQGAQIATGDGNQETGSSVRYGGAVGASGNFRLYAKTFDQSHTETATGSPVNDGWHQSQAGFRVDWSGTMDKIAVEGDVRNGTEAQPEPGEIEVSGFNIPLGNVLTSGANLTAHWDRHLSEGSDLGVVAYFDRTVRNVIPVFDDTLNIFDLQVQHTLGVSDRQTLTYGGEYRYGMDDVVNSRYIAFLPGKVNQTWKSLFAQDEIALRSDLHLTAGARIEANDYTGNEFLPTLRLAWKITPDHLLWGDLSRTVRAPSRLDVDLFAPGEPPYILQGGPQVVAEVARVIELGYRGQITPDFSYSATIYHAMYDHIRSLTLNTTFTAALFDSETEAATSGIETWCTYQAAPWWRLSSGFSALREKAQFYPNSGLQESQINLGDDPPEWWSVRSSFDLPHQTELDLFFRHVGALSAPLVPAYSALGLRLGWSPVKDIELSMAAQNLIGSGHGEFTDVSTRSQFGKTIYFKAVARF